MPTPTEKKALVFVAAIAFLGGGVRVMRSASGPPPTRGDQAALDHQLDAVDSARKTGRRKSGPGGGPRRGGLGPIGAKAGAGAPRVNGKLDLDVATQPQIQGLPGIGPVLAERIVGDREAHGPFGSIHALRTVRGIGPKIAARLDSMVTFSGAPRHVDTALVGTSDASRQRRRRSRARS